MGRSRGGLTTKIHALTDARGLPVRLILTPGQAHDSVVADELLSDLAEGAVVLVDKAYDIDRRRALIEAQGAAPNIPAKANRKWRSCYSKRLYKERNLIERFINRMKNARRIATRFEKSAANFLAMVKLAAIRLWLRAYEFAA